MARPNPMERADQTRINDRIRISPVLVITADGEQKGVIPTEEALSLARDAGLDLVEVAPNARPPVCRIMNYGKYKYEKNKKANKSTAHQTKTKEIRLRPKTGQHDIDYKVKKAISFLNSRDKVQISVVFRGREIVHVEEGRKVMEEVVEALVPEYGKIETAPSQQNRRIICTIAPR